MKHYVAATALLLTACGFGTASPPAASPSPAASTPAPSATPSASPSAAAACRLPVASGDAPTDGNPSHGVRGHGGFLQLPGATFTADAQSLSAYVLGSRTWVPVPRAWISPDGRSYAYPEYRTGSGPVTGIIHVIDIATAADHPLGVPAPSMPVSWEPAGIYVARVVPNSDARPIGLSLLDPATGSLRQLTASGAWTMIAGAAAYGADLDSSIAPPPGNGGPGGANRVWSLPLGGGQPTVAGSFPGTNVTLLGARGSDLLLGLITADRYAVKLGSAVLYDGAVTAPQPGAPAVVDGETIWFSGPGAVWRSVGGVALERFAVPGQLAVVAGACR